MVAINSENTLAFGVGLLGNILSFVVTLTPAATFYKVYKKKSTGSFQSIPYVVALCSALLWLYYGFLTRKVLLLTINSSTLVLESAYLAIYLFYASRKDRVSTIKMMLFLNIGLFGSIMFLTLTFLNGRRRVEITGWICASFAVSVFVAPLSIMRLIIKTKSVEYMPFSLSLFLTLSAIAWFFYGLLLRDYFVALPNVLGFLFGIAQIVLYFIYKNANSNRSQHEISKEAKTTADLDLDVELAEKGIHADPTEAAQKVVPGAAAAPEA